MNDVVFRATTRGGKYFVEVIDTRDNVDRYRIIQDGAVNYEDDINGVIGNLVTQSSYGEGVFSNIEIDKLGIGQEYLNILKQIKSKYGFLEKFEVASDGRQFYFRLMRYIGNNIKNGIPVEDVFKNADSIMKSYDFSNSRQVKSSHSGDTFRKITSARYIATNPESGEVLGSADTYEEAVNEWGEDVIITDSEAAENSIESALDTVKVTFDNGDTIVTDYNAEVGREEIARYYMGNFFNVGNENEMHKVVNVEFPDSINSSFALHYLREEDGQDCIWNSYDTREEAEAQIEEFKKTGKGPNPKFCEIVESSKTENDKNFLKKIVSSILTNEMSLDEAVEKIAIRNDVNIGYARTILSNALDDKSLVKSGVMEFADSINQEFDLNGDLYSWYKDYVKDEGKASTIGGELVRAANQIINEYNQTGDGIGYGRGRETVNPAARFIIDICDDYSEARNMSDMLDETGDIDYGAWIETFEKTFTDYLRDHEELFHKVNQDDFWEYTDHDADSYKSVDDCYIYDDDGNKYWFTRDGDEWICNEIEYEEKPILKVDDTISKTDDIAGKIDKTEPYGTFEENGFVYSYEADADDEKGEYDHWVITDVAKENQKANIDETWNASDFENEEVYDSKDNEISYRDLF